MALPEIRIEFVADTSAATVSIDAIEKAMGQAESAARKYKSQLDSAAKALKSGAIDATAYAESVRQSEAAYLSAASKAGELVNATTKVTRATDVAGEAMKSSGGHTANLAAQFNDIGVMMASGQSPFILAMQQGTQVNQVLQQMGTTGKDRLKALASAFTATVSPANLVTLGVVAGGAALVQWAAAALGASEEAETLEDVMDRLADATSRYKSATNTLDGGVLDLSRSFGTQAGEARKLLEVQQRLAKAQAEMAFSAAATEAADLFGLGNRTNGAAIREALASYDELTAKIKEQEQIRADAFANRTAQTNQIIASAEQEIKALESQRAIHQGLVADLSAAADQFGIAEADMVDLAAAAADVAGALTVEQQVNAAQRLAEEIDRVTAGFAIGDEAAFGLYQSLLDAVRAGLELQGLDMASGISSAASEATKLANELNRAVNNAIDLAAQGISDLRTSELRLQFKGDPVGLAGAMAAEKFGDISGFDPILREGLEAQRDAFIENAEATERNRQALIEWQKAQRDAAGGGGGKSEDSAMERLRESLATEAELLTEQYAAQQQLLEERYAKNLIVQEEYQELSKRSAEEYASAMAQIEVTRNDTALGQASMFFGALETAFQNGNDKMLKLAKTAGAAEALINAWRAYNQTLADPTVGFWGKFAAAASVLSAGMGAVNAIKGVSSSGGGGTAASAASAPSQTPIQISIPTLQSGTAVSSDVFNELWGRLVEMSHDNGVQLVGAV